MVPETDWKTALQEVLTANREKMAAYLREFDGRHELAGFGFVVADPRCPILANDPPAQFECRMLPRQDLADMLEFGASTDTARAAAYREMRARVVFPAAEGTLWCVALHREGMTLARLRADADAVPIALGDA